MFEIDLIEAIRQFDRSKFRSIFQFLQSDFFYEESLIKYFLSNRSMDSLPTTEFVDYSRYLRYYPDDCFNVILKNPRSEIQLRLPYQEVINFVTEPSTRIDVMGGIADYALTDEKKLLTAPILERFLQKKTKAVDNAVVRLASLRRVGSSRYECVLQRSSYFDLARTNLAVDFPLDRNPGDTWRLREMDPSNNLISLEESSLVNSIGVSAVIYFQRGLQRFFFMKLRHDSEGIFERMFSSVSGVMQLVRDERISELVSYAQKEIRREFYRETGLEDDNEFIVSVKPLALTRELVRAGKPQFFFLIQVEERKIHEDMDIRARFRQSAEGLDEFYDDLISNKASFNRSLSPELAMNLVYSFQYFQQTEKQPRLPIII